jgi:hypothetical protein
MCFFFLDPKGETRENKKKLVNEEEEEEEEMEQDEQEEVEEEEENLVTCPLCQEGFRGKETLEEHAMQIHSINSEGLQRLMMLMQGSHWLNNIKSHKDEDAEMSGTYFFKYSILTGEVYQFFLTGNHKALVIISYYVY